MNTSLHIREYHSPNPNEKHDFIQLVMPLYGTLDIEIEGKGQTLSKSKGAIVFQEASHGQESKTDNKSLIMDISSRHLSDVDLICLNSNMFFDIDKQLKQVISLTAHSVVCEEHIQNSTVFYSRLIIENITRQNNNKKRRIEQLVDLIQRQPFHDWTNDEMANYAKLSTSHFHTTFKHQYGITPHQFVSEQRLTKIKSMLHLTNLSIAEIAHISGFADQTALTRAMRNQSGITPAAYRHKFAILQ